MSARLIRDNQKPERKELPNAHLANQVEQAFNTLKSLTGRGITVTDIHLGKAEPELHVVMPRDAACLPGTHAVFKPTPFGKRVQQQACLMGCRVIWAVEDLQ